MKSLEIILRLLDKFIAAVFQKKAQEKHDKLENDVHGFFVDHFGGLQSDNAKEADKANTDNPK